MATFEIPAEPASGHVWWTVSGMTLEMIRDREPGTPWRNAAMGGSYAEWVYMLTIGAVSDADPNDVSWLYDLGRFPLRSEGDEILDADGRELLTIDGEWAGETDIRLAALIARLVNEHVTRRAEGGA